MDRLQEALRAIRQDGCSVHRASSIYSVPRTTLRRHLKHPFLRTIRGRPPLLSPTEEQDLEDMLIMCAEFRIGMSGNEFLSSVTACAKDMVQPSIGLPETAFGRGWYISFRKRHPRVAIRATTAENIRKMKDFTMEKAEAYIKLLQSIRDDGYLLDPRAIFNIDESGFKLAHLYSKTFALKGARHARSMTHGSDRDQISTLFGGSADGVLLRPLVLYKAKMFKESWFDGLENEICVAKNDSGMMDNSTFCSYVEQEIIPKMIPGAKNILIFDGHCSHVYNKELVRLCMKHKLRLMCLPAGQTSQLQPMDISVFGGLKKNWNEHLKKSARTAYNQVTRHTFPRHLAAVCSAANFERNLVSGFAKSGIYPFDPFKIKAAAFVSPSLPPETVDAQTRLQTLLAMEVQLTRIIPAAQAHSLMAAVAAAIENKTEMKKSIVAYANNIIDAVPGKLRERMKNRQLNTESGLILDTSAIEKILNDRDEAKKRKRFKKRKIPAQTNTRVQYSPEAQPGSEELNTMENELFTVMRRDVGVDLWGGQNVRGEIALFPAPYVEDLPAFAVSETPSSLPNLDTSGESFKSSLETMTVVELKAALGKKGLLRTGVKAVLLARLLGSMSQSVTFPSSAGETPSLDIAASSFDAVTSPESNVALLPDADFVDMES